MPLEAALIEKLSETHKTEVETLAGLVKAQLAASKTDFSTTRLTFSLHGAVKKGGDYFCIGRLPAIHSLKNIRKPGFSLIHGPRRSGKTTLVNQIIKRLNPDHFVFGTFQLPNPDIPVSKIWVALAQNLSHKDTLASPQVREAAKDYLTMPPRPTEFLRHLFNQNYGGKKLILFWDEFDRATVQKYRLATTTALRGLRDAVIANPGPSSFGGVIGLGAFNSTLVGEGRDANFSWEKVYSHETLDFSLTETQDLFEQARDRGTFEIDPDVVKSIQEETGGHAGLVGTCGRFIVDKLGGKCDLAKWQNSTPPSDRVHFRAIHVPRAVEDPP